MQALPSSQSWSVVQVPASGRQRHATAIALPGGGGAQAVPGGHVPPQTAVVGSGLQVRGGSVVVVVPGGPQSPMHDANACAHAATPASASAPQP